MLSRQLYAGSKRDRAKSVVDSIAYSSLVPRRPSAGREESPGRLRQSLFGRLALDLSDLTLLISQWHYF